MPAATAAAVALAAPVTGNGTTSSRVAAACNAASGQSSLGATRCALPFQASSITASMNADSAMYSGMPMTTPPKSSPARCATQHIQTCGAQMPRYDTSKCRSTYGKRTPSFARSCATAPPLASIPGSLSTPLFYTLTSLHDRRNKAGNAKTGAALATPVGLPEPALSR